MGNKKKEKAMNKNLNNLNQSEMTTNQSTNDKFEEQPGAQSSIQQIEMMNHEENDNNDGTETDEEMFDNDCNDDVIGKTQGNTPNNPEETEGNIQTTKGNTKGDNETYNGDDV